MIVFNNLLTFLTINDLVVEFCLSSLMMKSLGGAHDVGH